MDPVCHTLAGAALGQSGLKKRSGLAMATLIIGANFPDIDVLAVPLGMNLEFRRGWTHGILAMVLLPLVLTGVMLAWDRLVRQRGGRSRGRPVVASQLLLLAFISILSHPALDFLNTYGVRLLMPFSGRWFQGDALFIVDPWVLLLLAGGILLTPVMTRRRDAGRQRLHANMPAVAALTLVVMYALGMLGISARGRAYVHGELRDSAATHARQGHVMVAPVPVHPLERDVVIERGRYYAIGRMQWSLRQLPLGNPSFAVTDSVERHADHPAVLAAAQTSEGAAFLRWSRLPFFQVVEREEQTIVHMADLRYARRAGAGWATRTVVLHGRPGAKTE